MKRNKMISGRNDVRFYDAHRGVVYEKRAWVKNLVFVSILILTGAGGLFGINYIENSQQVLASSDARESFQDVQRKPVESLAPVALQAREDEDLARQVKGIISDMPKTTKWSISVRDLNTGRMANVNADKKMESASLYKLFLLAALEEKLSPDYWYTYLGNKSVEECVVLMIKVSDNDCPQYLADYTGRDKIDAHNKKIGFKNTIINTKNDGHITTARDVGEMMYRLQDSKILNDKTRRLVFDGLYDQKYRDGIPAGCGEDCLVANKTGEIDDVKHDAAIVTHDDARYVVVIMSQGDSTWADIASIAHALDDMMRP